MLLGKEVSAVSAALGAAVVDPGLDEHIARKAHKVRQTRRRARPPFTRARRAVVRVREVRLEVVQGLFRGVNAQCDQDLFATAAPTNYQWRVLWVEQASSSRPRGPRIARARRRLNLARLD